MAGNKNIHAGILSFNLCVPSRDWKYLNALILRGCSSLNANEKTSHSLKAFIALNGRFIQQNSASFEQ